MAHQMFLCTLRANVLTNPSGGRAAPPRSSARIGREKFPVVAISDDYLPMRSTEAKNRTSKDQGRSHRGGAQGPGPPYRCSLST
ncbi:unnamed protein product [Urochloa humidicola]